MLSPQVTARRVGPPPTAVSAVKQPPSPMEVDYRPKHYIPPVPLNYRAKDYLQFLGKGNRQGKVFAVCNNASDIVVQYNRVNGQPHYVRYCQHTHRSYVLKAPDSKYHVPTQWEAAHDICEQLSHSQARKSLPFDKKIILSNIAKSQFYLPYGVNNETNDLLSSDQSTPSSQLTYFSSSNLPDRREDELTG